MTTPLSPRTALISTLYHNYQDRCRLYCKAQEAAELFRKTHPLEIENIEDLLRSAETAKMARDTQEDALKAKISDFVFGGGNIDTLVYILYLGDPASQRACIQELHKLSSSKPWRIVSPSHHQ